MSRILISALLLLVPCTLRGGEILLNKKKVDIVPPPEFVFLDAEAIKKRFYKGNPPHVVLELVGTASTITIRESVTLSKDLILGELGASMLDTLKKSTKQFVLIEQGEKKEGDSSFFELRFTDVNDNAIPMTRRTRMYAKGRTMILVSCSIPTGFVAKYEPRMLQSIRSMRFIGDGNN
jgi:hypothetical protein